MRLATLFCLLLFSASVSAQAPKGGLKTPAGTTAIKDVAYATEHARQKLDVYVPEGAGPFPCVLWIHGGGWEAGSKEGIAVAQLMWSGYVVASTNYRYSSQAIFPAQIEDVKKAIEHLRENAKRYKINENAIGVSGGSAGGHLSALIGTVGTGKHKVQCVVDFFGPTDLAKLSPSFATNNPITKLLGGTTGEKQELAKQANPITFISKDDPPFLIIHGDKDTLVPVEQSQLLHDALQKAGVESKLIVIPGAGHGNGIFTSATTKEVQGFFDKHLKKKQ